MFTDPKVSSDSFPLAVVLQRAEGLIWRGRKSQRPLAESENPGEGQQPPEGQSEEHEASFEASQKGVGSKLQTASRIWTRTTASTTGHQSWPETHS